jgi:ATP-binding cassette subfamily C protein
MNYTDDNWIIIKILRDLLLKYKSETITSILLIFFASIFESLSFISIIPLFQTIIAGEGSQGPKLIFLITYIDEFFGKSKTVFILMACVVAGVTIKSSIMYYSAIRNNILVNRIVANLRIDIIQSLFSVHLRYFKFHPIGIFANAITGEAIRAGNVFRSVAQYMAIFLQCVMFFVLAFSISIKLALFALVCAFAINRIFKKHAQKVYNSGNSETLITRQLSAAVADTLQGIKYLKAMGTYDISRQLFIDQIFELDKIQNERNRSIEFIKSFQEPILITILILALATNHYLNFMPIVDFFIFIFLFQRLLSRFQILQEYQQEIYNLSASYWAIFNLIEDIKKNREEENKGISFPSDFKELIFDNVSFIYDRDFVFTNFSFRIPSNSLVGIRGDSGSGKTTLVDLIGRLDSPTAGIIWVDDLNIGDIDLNQWRSKIGYVPQEMFLLNDTIFNNIALGQKSITIHSVEMALRSAGIWDFVSNLENGIDTIVGERGSLLSGGQRQRISLARAIVGKPSILIVDEIAASLDQTTARDIYLRLKEMSAGMIVLVISHQEEIFNYCDVVIEVGKTNLDVRDRLNS